MKISEARRILAAYAEMQYGLVTTAQAKAEGIDTTTVTRLAGQGMLRRIRRGVYLLEGVIEDEHVGIRAAWLAAEPGRSAAERIWDGVPIVVSHESAAQLWGLGDVIASKYTMTTPVRKRASAADVRYRTAAIESDDWVEYEGVQVTTVIRTLRDLAKDGLDGDYLYRMVSEVLYQGVVEKESLERALEPFVSGYGFKSADQMLGYATELFGGASEVGGLSRKVEQSLTGSEYRKEYSDNLQQSLQRYAEVHRQELQKSLDETLKDMVQKVKQTQESVLEQLAQIDASGIKQEITHVLETSEQLKQALEAANNLKVLSGDLKQQLEGLDIPEPRSENGVKGDKNAG